MRGFHTATLCADCDPPVVAISTGNGLCCPRCGQVETWPWIDNWIIADTGVKSDADARLCGAASSQSSPRPADAFHAHLDVCMQCAKQPFQMCRVGASLLVATAQDPGTGG